MNRTFEWGVGIATLLSVLRTMPRHCARLTDFLHPKLRQIKAALLTRQLLTPPLRRLRCACGAQDAAPEAPDMKVKTIRNVARKAERWMITGCPITAPPCPDAAAAPLRRRSLWVTGDAQSRGRNRLRISAGPRTLGPHAAEDVGVGGPVRQDIHQPDVEHAQRGEGPHRVCNALAVEGHEHVLLYGPAGNDGCSHEKIESMTQQNARGGGCIDKIAPSVTPSTPFRGGGGAGIQPPSPAGGAEFLEASKKVFWSKPIGTKGARENWPKARKKIWPNFSPPPLV